MLSCAQTLYIQVIHVNDSMKRIYINVCTVCNEINRYCGMPSAEIHSNCFT